MRQRGMDYATRRQREGGHGSVRSRNASRLFQVKRPQTRPPGPSPDLTSRGPPNLQPTPHPASQTQPLGSVYLGCGVGERLDKVGPGLPDPAQTCPPPADPTPEVNRPWNMRRGAGAIHRMPMRDFTSQSSTPCPMALSIAGGLPPREGSFSMP